MLLIPLAKRLLCIFLNLYLLIFVIFLKTGQILESQLKNFTVLCLMEMNRLALPRTHL